MVFAIEMQLQHEIRMHIILQFLWEKMVDAPCNSVAVGFTTDEFIEEKVLIDGEYTEEHYESTSKGDFSLSEDDENAEMLQTILEGLYSNTLTFIPWKETICYC